MDEGIERGQSFLDGAAERARGESASPDWPEPQPLAAKVAAEPYPFDALPETIRAAVEEVQGFTKAPVPLVASSALAALSLAIQAHADVKRAEKLAGPVGLFLLTIADSGERKSTCDERVRASHRAWDNLTLPVDHPFWHAHTPPNGWRCRCRITSMSQAEYDKGLSPTGQQLVKQAPPEEFVEWKNKRSGEMMQVPKGIDPGFDYNPGKAMARAESLDKVAHDKLAFSENLNGASPRELWNRIVSELSPSEIMKMKNLDPALLENVGAVKAAEYYIRQVREGILKEIAQGGLPGSAALKHEITEVAALHKAGLNIYDQGDIGKIVSAFSEAEKTLDPAAHIPWHLVALNAELVYVQGKLAERGVFASIGECARAVYGDISGSAAQKMAFELNAIGASWPDTLKEEVSRAIQD
ncbi:MAG: DUF3987 domain-containing protein [Sulfurimicrobium sp.]|nr:DUF3987 domain-containing protein [Sulfurimicrobium sp.]